MGVEGGQFLSVRWATVLIVSSMAFVAGCGQRSASNEATAMPSASHPDQSGIMATSDDLVSAPSQPLPPDPVPTLPKHNYDERRGFTYYYISALSDEDRTQGKAVGEVMGFQYVGQNAQSQYVLAAVQPNGAIRYRAKCSDPCRIIDTSYDAEIPYSPASVIGAAFEDAFGGKLEIAAWAKEEAAQAAQTAHSQTQTPPGTQNDNATSDLENAFPIAPKSDSSNSSDVSSADPIPVPSQASNDLEN